MEEIETKSDPKVWAKMALDPLIPAALTIQDYSIVKDLSFPELLRELQAITYSKKTAPKVPEILLLGQAYVLDVIFGHLCRMALPNGKGGSLRTEYLELALKTQRHCRSTLESLKNVEAPERKKFPPNELEINEDAALDR